MTTWDTTLSPRLAVRFLLDPSLKLILPKAPDAANLESGNFALSREAGDGEGVNPEDL
jgi:hypothetical protein